MSEPEAPTEAPVEKKAVGRLRPVWWEHFRIGEILPWKGVEFRVVAVGPPGILLSAVNVKIRKLARHGDVRMERVDE